jgi:hypothetical protein
MLCSSAIRNKEASLTPGTHHGRYEIRSQLGVGGMGKVYLSLPPTLTSVRIFANISVSPARADANNQ